MAMWELQYSRVTELMSWAGRAGIWTLQRQVRYLLGISQLWKEVSSALPGDYPTHDIPNSFKHRFILHHVLIDNIYIVFLPMYHSH